jgi:transaldolase
MGMNESLAKPMYITQMKNLKEVPNIKIYLDSASTDEIFECYRDSRDLISGFTTNPTLMHNSGVKDYKAFIKEILAEITDLPISFEVFADDLNEMKKQANILSGIGPNVFVKIPVTNTKGVSTHELVSELNKEGVLCNVTAIMKIHASLDSSNSIILSVFAGRIADTGRNPEPLLQEICQSVNSLGNVSVLWASTRELLNIFQAASSGCDIVTVTSPLLKKLQNVGKDLDQLSLETVEMFYNDAKTAGYSI